MDMGCSTCGRRLEFDEYGVSFCSFCQPEFIPPEFSKREGAGFKFTETRYHQGLDRTAHVEMTPHIEPEYYSFGNDRVTVCPGCMNTVFDFGEKFRSTQCQQCGALLDVDTAIAVTDPQQDPLNLFVLKNEMVNFWQDRLNGLKDNTVKRTPVDSVNIKRRTRERYEKLNSYWGWGTSLRTLGQIRPECTDIQKSTNLPEGGKKGVYVLECKQEPSGNLDRDSHPDPTVLEEDFQRVVYVGSSIYDIRGRILSHISKDLTGANFTSIHPPTEIVYVKTGIDKVEIKSKEGEIAKKYHDPSRVFAFSDMFDS